MGVVTVLLVLSVIVNVWQFIIHSRTKSKINLCQIDCELRQDRMRSLESELEECNRKRLDDIQPEGNLEVGKPKRKPRRKSTK